MEWNEKNSIINESENGMYQKVVTPHTNAAHVSTSHL